MYRRTERRSNHEISCYWLNIRTAADPCVLQFNFTPSSVTIKEMEGCGSHRGLHCVFEGTFARKKETPQRIKSNDR